MDNVKTFFDKKKEGRCLSNFWECDVSIVDGDERRVYDSGELCFHGEKYFRVGKLSNNEDRKRVLFEYGSKFLRGGEIKSSKEAKMRGGKGKKGLRLNIDELKNWDILREKVQFEICKWKIENYEEVKNYLLEVKSSILVHPALRCNDDKVKSRVWEGRAILDENGKVVILGGNKLGNMWMSIRDSM